MAAEDCALERNLSKLSGTEYDLLVIGGGINGVCTAWDAALRGLSVALVEKGDFGEATSSATLRIVHGGLRYLQHLDFRRMRESIQERMVLMRIAPHLVHRLPFLIPTYGHARQGPEALAAAMLVNDVMSHDRNQLPDPEKFIPRGRLISAFRCSRILPGLDPKGLTGGAIFYDAQMHNSERLTLSFARSAVEAGADLANYAEVVGFALDGRRVDRTRVKDVLTGEQFDVRAKVVANITGPWSDIVLGLLRYHPPERTVVRSKGIQIVAPLLCEDYAFSIPSQQRDVEALLSRGKRLLFVTPWRGRSLIGTTDVVYKGDPDHFTVTERDITEFVEEVNAGYPGAGLKPGDVTFWYGGLRPITEKCVDEGASMAARKYEITDHAQRDRIHGLISVVGVKYTTCRLLAEKVVDLVFRKLGYARPPRTLTKRKPIFGGRIEHLESFLRRAIREKPGGLSEKVMRHLVYNYGSHYPRILRYIEKDARLGNLLRGSEEVLKAEVVHAVREEMAQRLKDVVMRRTDLGCLGHPGVAALRACADLMGEEFGWDEMRKVEELSEVRKSFSPGGGK
jgi:glycerol-3-phosphate dehydrogenase